MHSFFWACLLCSSDWQLIQSMRKRNHIFPTSLEPFLRGSSSRWLESDITSSITKPILLLTAWLWLDSLMTSGKLCTVSAITSTPTLNWISKLQLLNRLDFSWEIKRKILFTQSSSYWLYFCLFNQWTSYWRYLWFQSWEKENPIPGTLFPSSFSWHFIWGQEMSGTLWNYMCSSMAYLDCCSTECFSADIDFKNCGARGLKEFKILENTRWQQPTIPTLGLQDSSPTFCLRDSTFTHLTTSSQQLTWPSTPRSWWSSKEFAKEWVLSILKQVEQNVLFLCRRALWAEFHLSKNDLKSINPIPL